MEESFRPAVMYKFFFFQTGWAPGRLEMPNGRTTPTDEAKGGCQEFLALRQPKVQVVVKAFNLGEGQVR